MYKLYSAFLFYKSRFHFIIVNLHIVFISDTHILSFSFYKVLSLLYLRVIHKGAYDYDLGCRSNVMGVCLTQVAGGVLT